MKTEEGEGLSQPVGPAPSQWLSCRQVWEPSLGAGPEAFSVRLMAVWPIPLSQAPPSWLNGVAHLSPAHLPPLQPHPVPWAAASLTPCSAPAVLGLWVALLAVSTKALWLGQSFSAHSAERAVWPLLGLGLGALTGGLLLS